MLWSIRTSRTGSARGGGSSISRGRYGSARWTSIIRSEGGFCSSKDMAQVGFPTTAVTGRCAVNVSRDPAGDQPPNRRTPWAASGRSPRRARAVTTVATCWLSKDEASVNAPSTVAGASARSPRAEKSSPPLPSTVSSAAWAPKRSTTVSSSPDSSSRAVTPPGRTQYRSCPGTTGSSPGCTNRGLARSSGSEVRSGRSRGAVTGIPPQGCLNNGRDALR
ncbi:hypothetical protein ACFFX0_07595 [Citricoccus parietis]|uniref:Uncharacterized protein n=1 Tax=Citricoccus parietis TaxID=592307 RepID=A0ABV5FWM3_9MICC